jgi:hypothetical protein
MISASRLMRPAAAAAIALALSGCASMNVRSHSEPGFDLTRYQTYGFAPADRFSTGDPRLDNNPFVQERVRASVERELAARGFELSTSGAPDLLIHYHASVAQRIDVSQLDRKHGYQEDDERRPSVYEAGTFVLDFVDVRTNRLVWRGWAEDSVDGLIDNQDWLEKKIDEAVTRILETLPRRL